MALTYDECAYNDPLHPKHDFIATVEYDADRTVSQSDMGKVLLGTKVGSAWVVTLPTPSVVWNNQTITMIQTQGQNMVVQAATNDLIFALNNAAADTITYQTAANLIGATCKVTCLALGGTYYWFHTGSIGVATIAG